jgi:hypothetical protein
VLSFLLYRAGPKTICGACRSNRRVTNPWGFYKEAKMISRLLKNSSTGPDSTWSR